MGITIGLPFYNAEKYLELAIKSVFAQTYQDWELILMDDGSTDNSLAIAKSINDPRVKVYSDGKNKKLAGRLNDIVGLAKYDYLARMDADDVMSTKRIKRQMDMLTSNPQLDMVSTGTVSIANDLTYLGARNMAVSHISFNDLLTKKAAPLHASIVSRTAWFKRNRYNESLKIAQDYDLWLRACKNNDFKVEIISDLLYYYREENNATTKKVLAAYKNERVMYKKYAGHMYYKLWAKSQLKSLAVRAIALLNKEDILLKRRSHNSINELDRAAYLEEIKIIKNTILPKF